jgi:hypothetical protein
MVSVRPFLSIALMGVFLSVGMAIASETPSSEPTPPPAASAEPPPPPPATADEDETESMDVIICKTEPPEVGSRLGKRKICKTRREWRAEERDSTADSRWPTMRPTPPQEGGIGGSAR